MFTDEGELEQLKKAYEYTCSYITKLVSEKLQRWPESYRSCTIYAIEVSFNSVLKYESNTSTGEWIEVVKPVCRLLSFHNIGTIVLSKKYFHNIFS